MRTGLLLVLSMMLAPNVALAGILGWHDQTNFAESVSDSFGWVCNADSPSRTYEVKVYDGSTYIGSTLANIQREQAVANLCQGSAHHGFLFHYPSSVLDGAVHQIYARAKTDQGDVLLPGSPVEVQFNSTHQPRGQLEDLTSDYAYGWACDPFEPNAPGQGIIVSFYSEDGTFLGSTRANLQHTPSVAGQCGGASSRGFVFTFPRWLGQGGGFNGVQHTVYAVAGNTDGTGREVLPGTPVAKMFDSYQGQPAYAQSPASMGPNDIDSIIGTVYNQPNAGQGHFTMDFYCFGPGPLAAVSWDPSVYSGLSVPAPLQSYQRGPTNVTGASVAQVDGDTAGVFVNTDNADAACGGIGGISSGFAWQFSGQYPPPLAPNVWQYDFYLKRELIVSGDIKVPYSTGISYAHIALFFRDQRNNKRLWLDSQIFDSRPYQSSEFIGSAGSSPILATALGVSGSFGRTVDGEFWHSNFSNFRHFEWRVSGYQFENVLAALGCSNSDPSKLSCKPSDYRLTIADIITEGVYGAEIGSAIRDIKVAHTLGF